MCEPTTIIMGISAVVGAVGAKKQGDAANAAAKSNAAMMRQKGEDEAHRGMIEEQKVRRQGEANKANQIASFAANGIDIGSGTATDIIADTAMMTELDALTVRSNSERAQYYQDFSAESALAAGANAQSQGNFNAAGSLLGGAAKTYGAYQDFEASKIVE